MLTLRSLRTPLVELRSALALAGLRTVEDYDELVHTGRDCEARLQLVTRGQGQQVRCQITLGEERMLVSGLELFNEIALEGHPIVAFGAGRGQAAFEFQWFHPKGADWRISCERLECLMQRLTCALGPQPAPARRASKGRRPSVLAELVPAVLMPAA